MVFILGQGHTNILKPISSICNLLQFSLDDFYMRSKLRRLDSNTNFMILSRYADLFQNSRNRFSDQIRR